MAEPKKIDTYYIETLLLDLHYMPHSRRRKAEETLLDIGNDAIEFLIAALEHNNWQIRGSAASILGSLEDDRIFELLLLMLDDKHQYVRNAAINGLKWLGDDRAIKPLIFVLKNDKDVSYQAQVALANLGEVAAEPVIALLTDEDSSVCAGAARIVGYLGDTRAVEPLINLLTEEPHHIRHTAISALGQLGDPRAVTPLIEIIYRRDTMRVVAEALGNLGDMRAADPLFNLISEDYGDRSHKTILALATLQDERAIELLFELWNDKTLAYSNKTDIAKALSQFGDLVFDPLVAKLNDDTKAVREGAAETLGYLGDERAINPLLDALDHVGFTAAKALAQFGTPVVPLLIGKLNHPNKNVRFSVVTQLGILEDIRAVSPLIATLQDSKVDIRRRAASVLGRLGDRRAVEPLITALQDPNDEVRKDAASALVKLDGEQAVEALLPLISETEASEQVRRIVLSELSQLDDSGFEPLVAALLNHSDASIRAGIATILRYFGEKSFEPLIQALDDPISIVRKCAIRALGTLGDQRAIKPILSILDQNQDEMYSSTVFALALLGHPRGREGMRAILQDKTRKKQKRRRAANVLKYIRDKQAVDAAIVALNDDDWVLRYDAAELLGVLDDARAIESLIAAIGDEDVSVQDNAVQALEKLGAPAVEPMLRAFYDETNNIQSRHLLADVLNKLGESVMTPKTPPAPPTRKYPVPVFKNMLSDREKEQGLDKLNRIQTVEQLLDILSDIHMMTLHQVITDSKKNTEQQAIDVLLAILDDDTMTNLVALRDAIQILGRLGDTQAVQPLIRYLASDDNLVRTRTAQALGQLGDIQAIEPLITILGDSDGWIRKNVRQALVKFGEPAIQPLIHVLDDKNRIVCHSAVIALGKLGNEQAVISLTQLLSDTTLPFTWSNKTIADVAANALQEIGTPEALDALRKAGYGDDIDDI